MCVRYGLRYTAKVLRDSLHEKFPQASEEELYKVSSIKGFISISRDGCVCEFCVVWSVEVGASVSLLVYVVCVIDFCMCNYYLMSLDCR